MIDTSMEAQTQNRYRLCDYCNTSIALLYCRADSAKLCFSCDKEVHATNQLFTKHSRSQLCDACDDSPASVFCETEQSVLCQNCDWQRHSPFSGGRGSSSVHSRRPVEGFTGCPSVTELVAIVGLDNLSDKALLLDETGNGDGLSGSGGFDGSSEFLLWETPEIVSLNDLIASSGSGHNYRAMEVPPLPKNRNATCGKHKQEMLLQLRTLAKSEPTWLKYENADAELDIGFQFLAPEPDLSLGNIYTGFGCDIDDPSCEVSGFGWFGDNGVAADEEFSPSSLLRNSVEEKPMVSCKASGVSCSVKHATESREESLMIPVNTRAVLPRYEINSQERDSALTRYKEKKKTRRYDKHIRYESRKVRAESRTRIRGRFAKINREDGLQQNSEALSKNIVNDQN